MSWLQRLRVRWRLAQQRRLRRRLRAQHLSASRLELQWRLYEAEHLAGAYMRAWLDERDRMAQQIEILRAQVARRDEVIRSIRIGLQAVAAAEQYAGEPHATAESTAESAHFSPPQPEAGSIRPR